MTNPQPQTPTAPKLVSAALAELNTTLAAALPWLTCYGQGQRLSVQKDDRAYNYPAIYTAGQGGLDYLPLFPDEHLAQSGGFSWWDVQNPATYTEAGLRFSAGLVVWVDFRRAYPSPLDWKGYNIWNIADTVIGVLENVIGDAQLGGTVEIQDRPERIYPGLTHNDIDRQYSMMPYGVVRLDMEIYWNQYC